MKLKMHPQGVGPDMPIHKMHYSIKSLAMILAKLKAIPKQDYRIVSIAAQSFIEDMYDLVYFIDWCNGHYD